MSQQDREEIWRWNNFVPEAVHSCVHELITQVATEQPEKTAIQAWDGSLTYRQLDNEANQLALCLTETQGLSLLGKMIPICFQKSLWTTVTLLAILKAGGAFVALDPFQPQSRLLEMMQGLHSDFILCTSETKDIAKLLSPKIYIVDRMKTGTPPTSLFVPNHKKVAITPSSIMYAVYTSGSTGTPKGLLISHENLSTAARYQAHLLGFDKYARTFDYSSYSFDAYIFNTFYTLITGGCLCVPSDNARTTDIGSALKDMSVNVAQLTPSVARLIDPLSLPDLHTLILTGEKLTQTDVEPWLGRVRLINAFGPSECTIMCAANINITKVEEALNIGKGLGSVLWIQDVNSHSKLAPIGAVGEILIEGPIVGQGYLGDENKTEAALLRDPVWLTRGSNDKPGRRGTLFKTGDLGRYNSDGSLTIVGRSDGQIKLNGQRIETGDIEHHLRKMLSVGDDCVVDVAELGPNASKQLVCFLSVHSKTQLTVMTDRIAFQLAKELPRHMIPTSFLPIDKIPMTASGKTDRRALRQMAMDAADMDFVGGNTCQPGEGREPNTGTEILLQQLWIEILNPQGPQISADDSFFRRGGDSITAMKLIVAVQQRGYLLTITSIFTKPRLSEMALQLIQRNTVPA